MKLRTEIEIRTFFIVVESPQKSEKFILVTPENALDLGWLLRVCNEHLSIRSTTHLIASPNHPHLEYMECFKLDILTFISKEVHHHL